MRGLLLLLWLAPVHAESIAFQTRTEAEVVATLDLLAPGADWAVPGREAALVRISADGAVPQHLMVLAERRVPCRVFLGRLPAGRHHLTVERIRRWSAPGLNVQVRNVRFEELGPDHPDRLVIANAPILMARADTVGRFSDIPLLAYCEKKANTLEYTVIFSNEDGGTPTRALMARWGRTTDIEFVYRVALDNSGRSRRAVIQTSGHQEIEFRGRRENDHPVLVVSTKNNMVSDQGDSPIRYQLAPTVVRLDGSSREQVMDDHPWTYDVMIREVRREGRIRPFGDTDVHTISDPRRYLYIEANVSNGENSAVAFSAITAGGQRRTTHDGDVRRAIERSGWVRCAIELPEADLAVQSIGAECVQRKAEGPRSSCRVEAISKVFLLDPSGRPRSSFWSTREGKSLSQGTSAEWPPIPGATRSRGPSTGNTR